jgi:hypothetical protein
MTLICTAFACAANNLETRAFIQKENNNFTSHNNEKNTSNQITILLPKRQSKMAIQQNFEDRQTNKFQHEKTNHKLPDRGKGMLHPHCPMQVS